MRTLRVFSGRYGPSDDRFHGTSLRAVPLRLQYRAQLGQLMHGDRRTGHPLQRFHHGDDQPRSISHPEGVWHVRILLLAQHFRETYQRA